MLKLNRLKGVFLCHLDRECNVNVHHATLNPLTPTVAILVQL